MLVHEDEGGGSVREGGGGGGEIVRVHGRGCLWVERGCHAFQLAESASRYSMKCGPVGGERGRRGGGVWGLQGSAD